VWKALRLHPPQPRRPLPPPRRTRLDQRRHRATPKASLFFLRHGESQANEQNRFAGRLDTPLTALGNRQADQAAAWVAALAASGVRIDEVHMSTLQRARQTAWTVIDRLPQPPDRITVEEARTGNRKPRNGALSLSPPAPCSTSPLLP